MELVHDDGGGPVRRLVFGAGGRWGVVHERRDAGVEGTVGAVRSRAGKAAGLALHHPVAEGGRAAERVEGGPHPVAAAAARRPELAARLAAVPARAAVVLHAPE